MEESEFDFNKVIPTPVSDGFDVEGDEAAFMIYDATYGSDKAVAERLTSFNPDLGPRDRRVMELAHQYRLNFERYGYKNAQGWRYEHWGTSTPASHIEIRCGRASRAEVTFVTVFYPKPVLSRLAEQFPTVRIDSMVSQFQVERLVVWPALEDGQ